ncbi:hypothetical protein GCM10020218_056040 [Dactylosporangium vinaceum]
MPLNGSSSIRAGGSPRRARGDAEPLAHAEAVSAGAAPPHTAETGQLQHLVGAAGRQALGVREPEQVVAGAPAGLQRGRVEQGSEVAQRPGESPVGPAADEGLTGVGGVEPEDHAHGGGLAGPVGPDEPGDVPGPDRERHAVERKAGAEPLAKPFDGDRGVMHGFGCTRRQVSTRCQRLTPG